MLTQYDCSFNTSFWPHTSKQPVYESEWRKAPMEAVNEWNQWRRQIWGCEGQRNLYHAYKALILSVHLPEYVQWSLRYVLCIHILPIKRVDSALPNMTIQFRNDCHKIHTSEIPAWNTSRLSMWFVIWYWMVVGPCMHDMDVPVCQYARFGSAESTPNLMLPLTDASVSCVHDPTTL